MRRLSLSLAGFLMAATPAAADVTPRQVWDGWLASLAESDAEISTGVIEEAGDRLMVTDLSLSVANGEEGRYSIALDELILRQNNDGTVSVTVSPEHSMVLASTDEDGVAQETQLLVRHPDLAMTVADDTGTRSHAFTAPEIRIMIERVLEDGEPLDLGGELVVASAAGRYDLGSAEGQSKFSAISIAFDLRGTDPDTGDPFTAAIGMDGFESDDVLQIFSADMASVARDLPLGTSLSGGFDADATTFGFASGGATESSSFSGSLGPSETQIGISAGGLRYSNEARDVALTFAGSAIPLPEVNVGVESTSLSVEVPLLADQKPQPFAVSLSLLDVALDAGLWNMMDPAGILPRDPGAISLDISGEIEVDTDVDARDVAEDAGEELRSLDVNAARIAFAGAEIEAIGGLTTMPSPTGTPKPVGQFDLKLKGATQLLDRLVQAGIVPQEQAMGTRMMLSMFSRPGTTEEELVSTIRLTEDGRVFVNDQQVR